MVIIEEPDTSETTEPKNDNGEIQEIIEVIESVDNTSTEENSDEEEQNIIESEITETLNDSVYFIKLTSHDKWNALIKEQCLRKRKS